VKPENVLIHHGRAKLGDFGLLAVYGTDDSETKTAGTIAFFSPETILSRGSGFSATAADVWALGVTLYFVVFAGLPFDGGSLPELVTSILQDELAFPDSSTDAQLEQLLCGMLQRDPLERFGMAEMLVNGWVTAGGTEECRQPAEVQLGPVGLEPTE
jgi:[calcium/calmodulin-dependent protein kinase] kinase